MKRKIVMAFTVALLVTAVASAHDLFMRLDSYFLAKYESQRAPPEWNFRYSPRLPLSRPGV